MSLQQFLTNFGDDDCRYFTRRCSAEVSNSSIQIELCESFSQKLGAAGNIAGSEKQVPGPVSDNGDDDFPGDIPF